MSRILKTIDEMKLAWSVPRKALHNGKEFPVELTCEFLDEPADVTDRAEFAFVDRGFLEFWTLSGSAVLFNDVEYGQWGLEILTPIHSVLATERERSAAPERYVRTDLVIGNFLGDWETLVLDNAAGTGCGRVLVCNPIDERADWPVVASSFAEFLEIYLREQGAMYWIRHHG